MTLIWEPQYVQAGNEWDEMPGSRPIHKQIGERDPNQTRKHRPILRSPWVKAEQWEKGATAKERERKMTWQRI